MKRISMVVLLGAALAFVGCGGEGGAGGGSASGGGAAGGGSAGGGAAGGGSAGGGAAGGGSAGGGAAGGGSAGGGSAGGGSAGGGSAGGGSVGGGSAGGGSAGGGSAGGGSAGGGSAGGGSAGGGSAGGGSTGGGSAGGGSAGGGSTGGGSAGGGSTGGGSAGGGSAGGGSVCNAVAIGSAPDVSPQVNGGTPPVATGGTIFAGRYFVTAVDYFTDAGFPAQPPQRVAVEVSGSAYPYTMNFVTASRLPDGGSTETRGTYQMNVSDAGSNNFSFTMACPPQPGESSIPFSATATELKLVTLPIVQTLTKQ